MFKALVLSNIHELRWLLNPLSYHQHEKALYTIYFISINAVKALEEFGKTLGKRDWNFSADPCSGEWGWVTLNPVKGSENAVTCNCSFSNNTVCHIVSMYDYYLITLLLPPLSFFFFSKKLIQHCVYLLVKYIHIIITLHHAVI